MQYFLIALGSGILFLAVLLLLTGGTVQNLVGFFVEELDDHNTPVHPVKLFQSDTGTKLHTKLPKAEPAAESTAEPAEPEPPEEDTALTPPVTPEPEPPVMSQSVPEEEEKKPLPGKLSRAGGKGAKHPAPRSPKQGTKRNPSQAYTEIAILTHKIDERRRVVDSSGHSTLYDEYFELVFETRRGETLRLVATRAAFKEIPFNQEGALTYKRNRILKFKYNGGTVVDEIVSSQS